MGDLSRPALLHDDEKPVVHVGKVIDRNAGRDRNTDDAGDQTLLVAHVDGVGENNAPVVVQLEPMAALTQATLRKFRSGFRDEKGKPIGRQLEEVDADADLGDALEHEQTAFVDRLGQFLDMHLGKPVANLDGGRATTALEFGTGKVLGHPVIVSGAARSVDGLGALRQQDGVAIGVGDQQRPLAPQRFFEPAKHMDVLRRERLGDFVDVLDSEIEDEAAAAVQHRVLFVFRLLDEEYLGRTSVEIRKAMALPCILPSDLQMQKAAVER